MPIPRFNPIQPWASASGFNAQGRAYREYPAGAPFDAFFLKVWTLTGQGKPGVENRCHIIPDGCADLVFDLTANEGIIYGTMSAPQAVTVSGEITVIGVRMAPHAVPALTGIPASALRDATPTFAQASQKRLHEPFAGTGDFRKFDARQLMRKLAAQIDSRRLDDRAGAIVSALLSTENSVDRTSRKIGLCARQLNRLSQRELGLSPKMLSRILRVQRSLPSVLRNDTPHALVAATEGFSDQAHMIREYVDLTGYTPGFWREFRKSDFFNPP